MWPSSRATSESQVSGEEEPRGHRAERGNLADRIGAAFLGGTELDNHWVTTQRRQTNPPAVEPGEFEIGCQCTGGWSEAEPLGHFLLVAHRVERVVVVTVHTAIFVQSRVPRIACSRYCSKPFCKAKRVTPARVLTSALL